MFEHGFVFGILYSRSFKIKAKSYKSLSLKSIIDVMKICVHFEI